MGMKSRPGPSFEELAAELTLRSALQRAVEDGKPLVQDLCAVCKIRPDHEHELCIAHAMQLYHPLPGVADPEAELADVLGLSYQWAVDLLQGWDGDRPSNGVHSMQARRLGRRLWRHYGNRKHA